MKMSSAWIVSEVQLTGKFYYVMYRQKQRDGELKHKDKNLQVCFTSNKYNITAPVTCQTSNIFTQVVSLFDKELIFGQVTRRACS